MSEQSMNLVREGGKLLREEVKIRVAMVLILVLFVLTGRDAMTDPPMVYLAAALLIGALAISRFGHTRQLGVQQFQLSAVALAVVDLVAVTLLLRGSGGLHSGFFAFYLVSLIFAAAFFRGIELVLLAALTTVLYVGVSWPDMASIADIWHLSARLMALILVAWYAYALSSVLHREKEANDQLLRHLTEGVILFDDDERITLVNARLLSMLDQKEEQLVGRRRSDLVARDRVMSWLLGDVGKTRGGIKTRMGCFPDADLPLVECSTIPCGVDEDAGGWLVVCKDLRDLDVDTKSVRQKTYDKLAPLSNLRALSEALYGMAGYLDDKQRWRAIEAIEEHTVALQSLLADMLHRTDEHEQALELDFVEISSLLASTRRLLEIGPGAEGMEIEIFMQQGLPEVNADRARLGQSLLQLCRALMAVGQDNDKLLIDVRSGDGTIVFIVELVNKDDPHAAPAPLTAEERAQFGDLAELPIFRVIEEHHGHWECTPDCSYFRRVMFELPIAGPAYVAEPGGEEGAGSATARPRSAPWALEPALAADVTNQLKNTLNVIRGYAEMAMPQTDPQALQRALSLAIDLTDRANELVETMQPTTGEFDLEVKLPPNMAAAEAEDQAAAEMVPLEMGGENRVLVVDDDAAMRGLLVDVLKSAGYATMEAQDGKAAMERIRLNRPALAFVDLSMPRVTGVEVMRESRKYAPGMPIVLMTGYATQVAIEALGDEKPYAILSKPFTIEEVLSLARAVVNSPQ